MNHFYNGTRGAKWLMAAGLVLSSATVHAQTCQPLVWSDEFDGSSLDTNNWDIQTGDGCDQGVGMCGWGNSELQSYQAANLTVANGELTVTAKSERIKGTRYTSGRIRTANMSGSGEWAFGRYEARIKIPSGQGMWPAFWMLPTDPLEGWPTSGEIDILESTGQQSMFAYGTIHFGQPYPDNRHTGAGILKQPNKWSDGYHTYAIEWDPTEIRWYVDNTLYSTKTTADVAPENWPFDGSNNFHIILNLAVGGTWGGDVDNSALPQTMEVDYVRVYGGNQPNISGAHLAVPGSTETYSIVNPAGSASWSVTGGSVVSSSNSSADIQWDTASAGTDQTLTVNAGGCEVSTSVYVGKELATETVLEDFGGTSNMTYGASDGVYSVSGGELTYTRNGASLYDYIAYSTSAITDAGAFIRGDKAFSIDVNNTDPALVGKEILFQLENSSTSTPDNYPGGRHSKYVGYIENANGWQTLRLTASERPDSATPDNAVDTIVVLIDTFSNNSDTYVLDNIEILGESGSTGNNAPTASFSDSCTDLSCSFDGSASSDSDGSIASYSWDFGDGNGASGSTANHSYAAAGTYTVTLTVTDDQGATDSSSTDVTVTDGSTGGDATNTVVSSVATGTAGAGRGQKYGTASVTILDNLGAPVAGVTVTGDFSGTYNESASAVTDASGVASLQTSSTASGGVSVNFCVSSVTGGLPLDTGASSGICQ